MNSLEAGPVSSTCVHAADARRPPGAVVRFVSSPGQRGTRRGATEPPPTDDEGLLMSTPTKPFAVITGASSGIGLELAKQFAQHDHDLLLCAENDIPTEFIP